MADIAEYAQPVEAFEEQVDGQGGPASQLLEDDGPDERPERIRLSRPPRQRPDLLDGDSHGRIALGDLTRGLGQVPRGHEATA